MPDEANPNDEQHCLHIIREFACERLYFYAACVIEELSHLPSIAAMTEYENWPYAGAISEASFADEAFWAYSFDSVPPLVDLAYEHTIRSHCKKIVASLSDAEEEFLLESLDRINKSETRWQMIDRLVQRLEGEVLLIFKHYDQENVEEYFDGLPRYLTRKELPED